MSWGIGGYPAPDFDSGWIATPGGGCTYLQESYMPPDENVLIELERGEMKCQKDGMCDYVLVTNRHTSEDIYWEVFHDFRTLGKKSYFRVCPEKSVTPPEVPKEEVPVEPQVPSGSVVRIRVWEVGP